MTQRVRSHVTACEPLPMRLLLVMALHLQVHGHTCAWSLAAQCAMRQSRIDWLPFRLCGSLSRHRLQKPPPTASLSNARANPMLRSSTHPWDLKCRRCRTCIANVVHVHVYTPTSFTSFSAGCDTGCGIFLFSVCADWVGVSMQTLRAAMRRSSVLANRRYPLLNTAQRPQEPGDSVPGHQLSSLHKRHSSRTRVSATHIHNGQPDGHYPLPCGSKSVRPEVVPCHSA